MVSIVIISTSLTMALTILVSIAPRRLQHSASWFVMTRFYRVINRWVLTFSLTILALSSIILLGFGITWLFGWENPAITKSLTTMTAHSAITFLLGVGMLIPRMIIIGRQKPNIINSGVNWGRDGF